MSVSGSMSSYSFRGSSPSLTINGVTCRLNGPTVYSSYDGYNCNMRLINNVGKNLYIDLR